MCCRQRRVIMMIKNRNDIVQIKINWRKYEDIYTHLHTHKKKVNKLQNFSFLT